MQTGPQRESLTYPTKAENILDGEVWENSVKEHVKRDFADWSTPGESKEASAEKPEHRRALDKRFQVG